jgi:hypothetical protein
MQRRRYEILLPQAYNDGRPIEGELLDQTREELVARFGAVSLLPDPVRGIWVHEGARYEDALVRLVVDADDSPEVRQFFVDLKPTLLQRFQQIDIYIASYVVDVI